jgi:hypothetical protein
LVRTVLPVPGRQFFSERSDSLKERRRIERRKHRFPGENLHFVTSYSRAPHNERPSERRENAVHKTSPARKTTAQAPQTSTFPSDLTPAMDWIFRFELKKVGWVVKDMLGGIGALMPERAGTRFLTAGGRSAGILIV